MAPAMPTRSPSTKIGMKSAMSLRCWPPWNGSFVITSSPGLQVGRGCFSITNRNAVLRAATSIGICSDWVTDLPLRSKRLVAKSFASRTMLEYAALSMLMLISAGMLSSALVTRLRRTGSI